MNKDFSQIYFKSISFKIDMSYFCKHLTWWNYIFLTAKIKTDLILAIMLMHPEIANA